MRAVVIGAGMVGVSAAYHLAQGGAKVILIDRARPGSGATQGAFAMLIADDEADSRWMDEMYASAVADWRRLAMELPGDFAIQWGGTITWASEPIAAARLQRRGRAALSFGDPIETVDRDAIRRLAPGVDPGPVAAGLFSPMAGAVDPSAAHAALLNAARSGGVSVFWPLEATGFEQAGGRIVAAETKAGPLEADVVVLCTGVDAPVLADKAGGRVVLTRASGALAHTFPVKPVLSRVLNGPTGSIKQDPDGRIVTGLDYAPEARAAAPSRALGEDLLAKMKR
ncbi:MAG: NAD(P)/FAD-dependent oxidoreductase, partial [Caulobacteraceae bacterium]